MGNETEKSKIRINENNFINELDIELRRELGRMPTRAEIMAKVERVWQLYQYDQLGFIITDDLFYNEQLRCISKKNSLSFHHLRIKDHDINRERGPYTIHNCAALLKFSGHPFFHTVIDREPELGKEIKKLLIEINEQMSPPTKVQLIRSDEMFHVFEREHSADTTLKKEPLIKEVYTRRLSLSNASYYF